MEKSIEKIWKDGFLNNEALIAPKINDIYNKKSSHIIDKLKRMFKLNGIYVMVLAFIHLIIGIVADVPIIGIYIFLLFIPLILVSRRNLKNMKVIDKNLDSYHYLKSFDTWLKNAIADLTRFFRLFYPLYFLGFVLGMGYANSFNTGNNGRIIDQIMNNPTTYIVMGVPVFWIIGLVVLVILVYAFSGYIYKFDINSIYGRVFKKLDEILQDMEDLRSVKA